MSGTTGRSRPARVRRAWRAVTAGDVDLSADVGSVQLPNPVMTASGTSGHAAELDDYFPLAELGAVVVKSLSAEPWPGNPPPRVHAARGGMLNSVGLQGPGIKAWLDEDLPRLAAAGARTVVSIWGQRVEDFARAAALLSGSLLSGSRLSGSLDPGAAGLVAIEINVSCPNLEDRRRMFAQSPAATAEVVGAVGESCPGLPRWAKLSPATVDIAEVAGAALAAGAEAVTLVNTAPAMAIDLERRRPLLGGGPRGGGLSGSGLHPLAVRAVFDVRAAHPGAAIVGAGGVARAEDAVELVLAGADAVQVGTATFGDPRAPLRVLRGLERWCARRGVRRLGELVGAAHG